MSFNINSNFYDGQDILGGGDENVWKLAGSNDCTMLYQTHWIIHFKMVSFMFHELYFNKKWTTVIKAEIGT